MDPISTRQMKDLFIHLAKRGKTILLCSHLLADVEDVCDRIGILYGGKMQTEGEVKTLLQKSDESQIITDALSDDALAKIRQIVESEQSKCEISSPVDRLEDFFVRTVASAQQQHVPTSGAVNTATIGGFLVEESDKEHGVLEKLVTATVEEDKPIAKADVGTERVEAAPVNEEKSSLLDQLAGNKLEQVETDQEQAEEIEHIETVEEVNRALLDGLAGTDDKNSATEHTKRDNPQEADDA